MPASAFQIHPSDNVATLVVDAEIGDTVPVVGATETSGPRALDRIPAGHKIALCDISAGAALTKFGARIGTATRDIRRGEHIHLHNARSDYDERAESFDPVTGVPTGTRYA